MAMRRLALAASSSLVFLSNNTQCQQHSLGPDCALIQKLSGPEDVEKVLANSPDVFFFDPHNHMT